ncbi:hypothetical protein HJC99_01295 [Candidatus Saccharibacteria bacterium]|nr:hypothetical protein [Candidatus Saccharibacteria bacterium]
MRIVNLGKKMALGLQALTLMFGFGFVALSPVMVGTASATAAASTNTTCDPNNLTIQGGASCANPQTSNKGLFENGGIFQTLANTLIFLVGAIAVLFLIIGGLRYVISNGDPKSVTAAKDTILYAIVGIVVAILSYAAVAFVISTFTK